MENALGVRVIEPIMRKGTKKKPIFMKKNWKTKKSDYLCGDDVIFFHVICDFG
jgi:hypothetical protein